MLAALEEYKRDLEVVMRQDLARAYEEFSSIVLTITPKTVAGAINKILDEPLYVVDVDQNAIPTKLQVYNQVVKDWTRYIQYTATIFGSGSYTTTSSSITITLWAGKPYGTGTFFTGKERFRSYEDVRIQAMPRYKDTFADTLIRLMGSKEFDKIVTGRQAGVPDSAGGGTGKKGFNWAFSLSHDPGPTEGQMTGERLRRKTGTRAKAAKREQRGGATKTEFGDSIDEEKVGMAAGKEYFYGMAEQNIADIIGPATLIQLSTEVTDSRTLGLVTQERLPGNYNLEIRFDEIQAQKASKGHLDTQALRNSLKVWAVDFMKDHMSAPKTMEDMYFLEGSTSRANAHRILMQEIVLKQVVKAGKKFKKPIKVIRKPDKIRAKANKTKPKSGTRKTVKTKIRAKPITKNKPTGKRKRRPLTKAGRPDMRFNVNKQAWGGRASGSPIGLIQLLNKALPDELKERMTGVYPRSLEWRTGRFGQSAEVTSIVPFPNLTQIRYTYQKNPYQVFEPGSGSPLASGGRDPQAIIGETIRQIAQSIMGTRFGLVRTKRV